MMPMLAYAAIELRRVSPTFIFTDNIISYAYRSRTPNKMGGRAIAANVIEGDNDAGRAATRQLACRNEKQ